MCLLSYYPPGVMPSPEPLLAGVRVNGDGAGFAVWDGTSLITMHDLNGTALLYEFLGLRERYPGGPALFHSRWRTSRGEGIDACHPFPVPGIGVLAHNGTVPGLAEGSRSDSQVLAEDILPTYAGRLTHAAGELGNSSAVILTLNGHGVLLNGRLGFWQDGAWHSNSDAIPPAKPPAQPRVALRRLYRELGDAQRKGDPAASALRAALLTEVPSLRHGMEIK